MCSLLGICARGVCVCEACVCVCVLVLACSRDRGWGLSHCLLAKVRSGGRGGWSSPRVASGVGSPLHAPPLAATCRFRRRGPIVVVGGGGEGPMRLEGGRNRSWCRRFARHYPSGLCCLARVGASGSHHSALTTCANPC